MRQDFISPTLEVVTNMKVWAELYLCVIRGDHVEMVCETDGDGVDDG